MDYELDDDAIMIRDMMRRFVQKDAHPLEMPLFNQGSLSEEQAENLKSKVIDQMGLWAVTVPEDFGGDELDMISTCLIEEELGQTFVPIDYGDVPPVLFACNEEQEEYLEAAVDGERRPVLLFREPDSMLPEEWKTRVVSTDEGFELNGSKLLGVEPYDDDFYIVFAHTDEGISAFLVEPDSDGVAINKKSRVEFDSLVLDEDALLGEPGQGLSLGKEYLFHQQIKISARYAGMAKRLLEMSLQYAKDWVSMGKPLALRPATARMVAEMKAEIDAARHLVFHAAWKIDEELDARHEALIARLYTAGMLQRVMDQTIIVHGGTIFLDRYPALRMYRNLVPDQTLDVGLEGSRMAVANHLLELQSMIEAANETN